MVVIHDETVDRTTNGKGWVKDYTFEDLRKLDATYQNLLQGGEVVESAVATGRAVVAINDVPRGREIQRGRIACAAACPIDARAVARHARRFGLIASPPYVVR